MSTPSSHLTNPILASVDALSGIAILGYWLDLIAHPVAAFSTLLAGVWYVICIYDAIEKRFKPPKDE